MRRTPLCPNSLDGCPRSMQCAAEAEARFLLAGHEEQMFEARSSLNHREPRGIPRGIAPLSCLRVLRHRASLGGLRCLVNATCASERKLWREVGEVPCHHRTAQLSSDADCATTNPHCHLFRYPVS